MKIDVIEDKYNSVKEHYDELLEDKKGLESQLEETLFLFDKPELFDEETINELCEILDEESTSKFRSIEKYLKVINKFPNQSQIIHAKKVLLEVKENLISIVTEACNSLMDEIDTTELECREIYFNNIKNYESDSTLDISKVLYMFNTFKDSDFSDDLVIFLKKVLLDDNSTIITSDDNNIVNYSNMIISSQKDNNNEDNIDDNIKYIHDYLYRILYGKKLSEGEAILLKNLLEQTLDEKNDIRRMKFLIHIYMHDISFDESQFNFMINYVDNYSLLLKSNENNSKKCLLEKCENEINSEDIFTNIELIDSISNEYQLNNKVVAIMLLSIINNNAIKKEKNKVR